MIRKKARKKYPGLLNSSSIPAYAGQDISEEEPFFEAGHGLRHHATGDRAVRFECLRLLYQSGGMIFVLKDVMGCS